MGHESFLNLIRLGIGHTASIPEGVDWNDMEVLAARQGLTAIVLDGIEKLPLSIRPPQELLLQWIGEVLSNYENIFAVYEKAIGGLAQFYNIHGFHMMVIKGYACALNWPKPEHRPCGDIDIWLFGKQKEADALLVKEKGIKVDESHHHHTVFDWQGFTVENHYDFVNVYAHKSSAELENMFKELGQDDSYYIDICDEIVYLPSPNLHALFLIRHMVSHFAAAEITLRQVLDWAFFVVKYTKEIDWEWLNEQLEKFHMKDFFNYINAICIEDLGFSLSIFPTVQFLPSMKDKVLKDILDPEYTAAEPKGLFNRLVYKYQRWQGNAWKQGLCYNESRWSAFWGGIWAKILKPASF